MRRSCERRVRAATSRSKRVRARAAAGGRGVDWARTYYAVLQVRVFGQRPCTHHGRWQLAIGLARRVRLKGVLPSLRNWAGLAHVEGEGRRAGRGVPWHGPAQLALASLIARARVLRTGSGSEGEGGADELAT